MITHSIPVIKITIERTPLEKKLNQKTVYLHTATPVNPGEYYYRFTVPEDTEIDTSLIGEDVFLVSDKIYLPAWQRLKGEEVINE